MDKLPPDPEAGWYAADDIINALVRLDERPWRSWGRTEKPITPKSLGALLRPFACRTEMAGPKGHRVRRYKKDVLMAAIRRFPAKDEGPAEEVCALVSTCTPAHQAKEPEVSHSAVSGVRVSGSEAHTGKVSGYRAAPSAWQATAAGRRLAVPAAVGDILPDGRRVLEVDQDGIASMLSKAPRAESATPAPAPNPADEVDL